jgi:protein-tyrosine sulfotransferase
MHPQSVESQKSENITQAAAGSATRLTAPIFLLGAHKTGSSLLRSMLDGHPEVFAVPLETHFFQYTGYWVDYEMRNAAPREMSRAEKIEALVKVVETRQAVNDPYGDAELAGRFDVPRFRAVLDAVEDDSAAGLFTAYMRALHVSMTGREMPTGMRVAEKSVEHAECAVLLRQLFPDARFVHIVRTPYASLVALRKSRTRRRHPSLHRFVRALTNSYYHLYWNEQVLDRYLVLRYEDLVQEPERIMREVAAFLEISFEENLLCPTLLGESWGGNSTGGERFRGVSAGRTQAWKKSITDIEVRLTNRFLGPILRRFGYEQVSPRKPWYWPCKGERLKSYIANRSMLRLG